MKLHADSHIDHGLTANQLAHIVERFADRTEFFKETIELPPELGDAPCDLYGPAMGDAPIAESEVHYRKRGAQRTWESRCVHRNSERRTRSVSVIAGPHAGEACVLYTAFGGPVAPQEPGDPGCKDADASRAFWAEHALVTLPMLKLS